MKKVVVVVHRSAVHVRNCLALEKCVHFTTKNSLSFEKFRIWFDVLDQQAISVAWSL